ncbi:MAG: hypothetical protein IKM30_03640 [Oscillospiraceae bacterium]|nr:hypothetical protein [Oscillospiraceae bacterium]
MKEDLLCRRFADLADAADRNHHYTFTPFLTEAELASFLSIRHTLAPCGYTIWGGHENAERVMIRFGSEEELGFVQEFPICCIHIAPLQAKFADALTHRDVLGAVMHLGIERTEIGDILMEEHDAYLFCTETMAAYLCSELTRIKHTVMQCTVTTEIPKEYSQRCIEGEIQVASERIDAVIAKIYHISRSDCLMLFRSNKVFLNSRTVTNNSTALKPDDKISVRGFGKFRFLGVSGHTRKGNLIVRYAQFA